MVLFLSHSSSRNYTAADLEVESLCVDFSACATFLFVFLFVTHLWFECMWVFACLSPAVFCVLQSLYKQPTYIIYMACIFILALLGVHQQCAFIVLEEKLTHSQEFGGCSLCVLCIVELYQWGLQRVDRLRLQRDGSEIDITPFSAYSRSLPPSNT